ncbi:hypothetical protein C8Q80DRAFT_614120 [Daedaleopsis nitida]|nr:hypothetical protein C8Q80DRAFT_614120 [Daedaleopsis nitida]
MEVELAGARLIVEGRSACPADARCGPRPPTRPRNHSISSAAVSAQFPHYIHVGSQMPPTLDATSSASFRLTITPWPLKYPLTVCIFPPITRPPRAAVHGARSTAKTRKDLSKWEHPKLYKYQSTFGQLTFAEDRTLTTGVRTLGHSQVCAMCM